MKSLERVLFQKHPTNKIVKRKYKERFLKPNKTVKGYLHVKLTKTEKGLTKKIQKYMHHLVLENFIGLRKINQQARHLDGDPSNNNLDNLKWGSCAENAQDRVSHRTQARGEKMGSAKLSVKKVKDIRKIYAKGGFTQSQLAEKYEVTRHTVADVIYGRTWGWL